MAVALLARGSPASARTRTNEPPTLTVAIAVHDEAAHVAERIADALAQDGPAAPGSRRCSSAATGRPTGPRRSSTAIARPDPRVRLLSLPRAGQTATQHALFEAARGDVVVLTDAETRFAPGCLAALAEALRDPRVGCATGRLEWRDEGATATSRNEGLYWRYERRVRELESRAGWLTAVTGALLAVRRSSYRPVPPTASMDHLLPLYVREQGGLVVYVPDAVATDRPISGLREQFRSRTRTATRGIRANLSMVGQLAPWRHPGAALAIWSHKLLRWATPWFVALVAIAGLWLDARWGTGLPRGPDRACHRGAAGGPRPPDHRRRPAPPRIVAFARSFAVVNTAFALGWLNVLRGREIEVWHRAEFRIEG